MTKSDQTSSPTLKKIVPNAEHCNMPIFLTDTLRTSDSRKCAFRGRRLHNSSAGSTVNSYHRVLPFVTMLPEQAAVQHCKPQREAAKPREDSQADASASTAQVDVSPVKQCRTRQNELSLSIPLGCVLRKNQSSPDSGEVKDEPVSCPDSSGENRKIYFNDLDFPIIQPSCDRGDNEDESKSCPNNRGEKTDKFLADDDFYLYLHKNHPVDNEAEAVFCPNNLEETTETFLDDEIYSHLSNNETGDVEDELESYINNPGDFLDDDSLLCLLKTQAGSDLGNDKDNPERKTEIIHDSDDTYLYQAFDDSMTLLDDSIASVDDSIASVDNSITLLKGVCFNSNNNLVHEIETHESPETLWFSSIEFKFMKMRDLLLAELAENGNFVESEEHTAFGLGVGMKRRAGTAKSSRSAVLTEQARQRMMGQSDPMQITVQYSFASLDSWKKARHRGQQNAKHVLSSEQQCQVVTSPWQCLTRSKISPETTLPSTTPRNLTYGSGIKYDEEETESRNCLLPVKTFKAIMRQRPQKIKTLGAKMRRRLPTLVKKSTFASSHSPKYQQ